MGAAIERVATVDSASADGLAALQAHARHIGLTLLVLDTQVHSPAEDFYRGLGWQRAGEIPDYVSDGQGAMLGTALYFKPVG